VPSIINENAKKRAVLLNKISQKGKNKHQNSWPLTRPWYTTRRFGLELETLRCSNF